MQTFKVFLQIIRKNIPSIMIYVSICIVMIFIVGATNAEQEENKYKSTEIPFTVINRDGGQFGEAIKDYLSQKNEYIEHEDDISKLRNNLFYRNIFYVLIIPEGYEDALLSGEGMELEHMKVKDSAKGYYIDMEVSQYMMAFQTYIASGYSMEDAIDSTLKSLDEEVGVKMADKKADSSHKKNYYYYSIIPYILMSIIMTAIGPVYVAFNKSDVRRRINCSANSFKNRNTVLALSAVLIGVIVWLVFNVLAIIVYNGNMSVVEIGFNMLNTLCMSAVSVGLAFMCGNLANSNNILGAMVNAISMGVAFIGGVFVPLEVLSDDMQKIAKIMPTYWYVTANDAIVEVERYADLDTHKVFSCMGMQLLFAAAIFGIALVAVKKVRTRD